MYELQELIYNTLTGSTILTAATGDRIYFKHLPHNFKTTEINTVFILNTSSSEGSFDNSNEIEKINLDIKLNYEYKTELVQLAKEVKKIILNIQNEKVKYIEFLGNDLVINNYTDFYNLNLRFSLIYEE